MSLTRKEIGRWIYRDGGMFPAVLTKVRGQRYKRVFIDGSGGEFWQDGLNDQRLATEKEVLAEIASYKEEVRKRFKENWN